MLCPHCWGHTNGPDFPVLPCVTCNGTGVVSDYQLSPHFKLSEMVCSQTAVRMSLSNNPSERVIENLTTLCSDLLEHIHDEFGALHIDSGYRSIAVNRAVRGADSSAHVQGLAGDINPLVGGVTRKHIVDWLIKSNLKFDQVIFEGTWVHVGIIGPKDEQRRQALAMFPDPHSAPRYIPYDPTDPRVST